MFLLLFFLHSERCVDKASVDIQLLPPPTTIDLSYLPPLSSNHLYSLWNNKKPSPVSFATSSSPSVNNKSIYLSVCQIVNPTQHTHTHITNTYSVTTCWWILPPTISHLLPQTGRHSLSRPSPPDSGEIWWQPLPLGPHPHIPKTLESGRRWCERGSCVHLY